MPYRAARQTLQRSNQEDRTNQFICRRRNLITRASRIPINPNRQNEKEPQNMSPYIPRFIMNTTNTVHTLHFILVEAVSMEDVRIIVPVRGDFVDCKESFCAIFDGVGELIERLFCEVGAGVET